MNKYPGVAPTLIGIGAVVALFSVLILIFIHFFEPIQTDPEFRYSDAFLRDAMTLLFLGGTVIGLGLVIFGVVWGWIHRSPSVQRSPASRG